MRVVASASILGSALGFIGSIAAAKYLGPAAFGSIVLLQAIIFAVDRLVNFQSWRTVIKYGADAQERGDTEFKEILKFGTLLDIVSASLGALIAVGVSFFAADKLEWSPETHRVAIAYAAMISLNLTGTPTAALRMFDRYQVFVHQRVTTGVMKVLGVVVAWAIDGGALWVLGGWILGEFLGWLIVMLNGWRELRRRGLGDFMQGNVRRIDDRHPGVWRFAIITNISLAIRMGSKEVNDIVIGVLLSEHALGLFRVAKQFSVVIGMVHDAMAQPLYPDMSRYAAGKEWNKLREAFFGGMKIATMVVVPAWLGLAVFGHWLIYFTAGSEFTDAHLVMALYAFGVAIASILHGLAGLPMALNRPTVPLKAMLGATAVQYVVLLVLVGPFGLTAAGIAVVCHYVSWAAISAWFVRDVPALLRNQP